ncbi:MAG: hypothetical protein EG828_00660 [Deltaproteobacteria bacterium]|nr:hypothetical protein [Deltaproteobacteria bacterium]
MKILMFFCLTMLLCASSTLAEEIETLLGVSSDFEAGSLTIEVASSGCTDKGSFRLDFTQGVLTVVRVRKDTCKAMIQKTPVTFTVEEVGITSHKPFRIANPFLVNEKLAGVVVSPLKRHDTHARTGNRNG